jgi:hypothetical protein
MSLDWFRNLDDATILLLLGAAFLGALALFAWGLRRQKSKLSSGQEVARQSGWLEDGLYRAETDFTVSQPDRWCRVAADFEMTYSMNSDLKRREKGKKLHGFQLQLLDAAGRELHSEQRPLEDFSMWAKSRGQSIGLLFHERETGTQSARNAPLLELIPPHSGRFRVIISVPETAFDRATGVDAESRILSFDISVREDVVPLVARAYPHKRLDLRAG